MVLLNLFHNVAGDCIYSLRKQQLMLQILLSNPIETPKMADFGSFLRPGIEARVVIKPNKIESTSTLKQIKVAKRQCFFPEERYLQFYRYNLYRYVKLNCKISYIHMYTDHTRKETVN